MKSQRAESKESEGGRGTTVTTAYFRDMSRHGLLSPERESAMLAEIARLEAVWFREILAPKETRADLMTALPLEVETRKPFDPDQASIYALLRKVRFSEEGRGWMKYAAAVVRTPRASMAGAAYESLLHEFVRANLRLVVAIVKKQMRRCRSMNLDDLVQEGNLGLLKAAERFDHERGLRFSTYAQWWIKAASKRAILDKDMLIRLPVRNLDAGYSIAMERQRHRAATGEEPSDEQVAKKVGLSRDIVAHMSAYKLTHPLSLESKVGGAWGEGSTVAELVPDEDVEPADAKMHRESMEAAVSRAVSRLKPFEAEIVRHRFGLDGCPEMTLQELGERHKLSRERIRQIEAVAMGKLRDSVPRSIR